MSEGFTPEIPARLSFAGDVVKIHEQLLEKALASPEVNEVLAQMDPELAKKHKQYLFEDGNIDLMGLGDGPEGSVSANIFGSDHALVSGIGPDLFRTTSKNNNRWLAVRLFNDGSPFVPEEDIESGGEFYDVFVTQDGPPIAINYAYLKEFNTPEYRGVAQQIRINKLRQSHPDRIRYLTDPECKAILGIMAQSQIDTEVFAQGINLDLDTEDIDAIQRRHQIS